MFFTRPSFGRTFLTLEKQTVRRRLAGLSPDLGVCKGSSQTPPSVHGEAIAQAQKVWPLVSPMVLAGTRSVDIRSSNRPGASDPDGGVVAANSLTANLI